MQEKGGKTRHNALSNSQPEFYALIKSAPPLAYKKLQNRAETVHCLYFGVHLHLLKASHISGHEIV